MGYKDFLLEIYRRNQSVFTLSELAMTFGINGIVALSLLDTMLESI